MAIASMDYDDYLDKEASAIQAERLNRKAGLAMVALADKDRRLSKGRSVGRARVELDLKWYSRRVAARVRLLREKRLWSVEELADKIGVSAPTMYGYESGKRTIPPDLYPALAKAFGLSVRTLLPNE